MTIRANEGSADDTPSVSYGNKMIKFAYSRADDYDNRDGLFSSGSTVGKLCNFSAEKIYGRKVKIELIRMIIYSPYIDDATAEV